MHQVKGSKTFSFANIAGSSSEHAYHSSASKIQVPIRGGRGRQYLLFPAVLAAGWFGLGGLQVAYTDDDEKEVDSYTIRGTNKVVKGEIWSLLLYCLKETVY